MPIHVSFQPHDFIVISSKKVFNELTLPQVYSGLGILLEYYNY